jgi:hypothetical protein
VGVLPGHDGPAQSTDAAGRLKAFGNGVANVPLLAVILLLPSTTSSKPGATRTRLCMKFVFTK